MTQTLTLNTIPKTSIPCEIEKRLRNSYPNRNEKYYQILLSTWQRITSENFKLELTADAIIKSNDIARPTWYTYFKSVAHYYTELLEVAGRVAIDHAFDYLREKASYQQWTAVARELKMLVFLSNSKSIAAYFPELKELWYAYYSEIIDGYAAILVPILKLSPGRCKLFIKNIANEIIVHKEKYHDDLDLFDRFVNREYALFLAEQNN